METLKKLLPSSNAWIIISMIAVITMPFIFRKDNNTVFDADDTLVIITPHDEGIRFEFETAFAKHYQATTGRTIDIDWRVIGGTSEIVRYIQSTYTNNFRNYWESELGKEWNSEVQNQFINRKLKLDDTPEDDNTGEAAKRIFIASEVDCGIDILFGGGSYDFIQQSKSGTLIPFATSDELAKLFPESSLPLKFAGEPFYDKDALWAGAVCSQFGIIYNTQSLDRLGIEQTPNNWDALADPRLAGELAISDPTQSGSSTKAFEMIVQQKMLELIRAEAQTAANEKRDPIPNKKMISKGWNESMQLIQKISANARYFTDSSKKPSIDVSAGECAAGMSIDFYGRFQAETIFNRTGSDRFGYITPEGGSTVSVDPIGVLRGAPNEAIAKQFIHFVMSEEGQRLWNWKVGTPGGPKEYALRRSPVLKELYDDSLNKQAYRSDQNNPYTETGSFVYHAQWTARLFGPLRFIIKTAFIDPHKELAEAWKAIQRARNDGRNDDADRAEAVFSDIAFISYENTTQTISTELGAKDKIAEVKLAREITLHFRDRYIKAKKIANGK